MITKVLLDGGMGDALNARSFLATYCSQKKIPHHYISIFTQQYWWMFEGMGFSRGHSRREFKGLTGYRNFGCYNLPKAYNIDKNDECIARNACIDYTFDVVTPLPDYGGIEVPLPEKFITINTGYGDLSGRAGDPEWICTKAWPIEYWNRFVELIGVPCVQIGSGISCKPAKGVTKNYVDKLSIKGSAEIMRKALFHVDIEGGLTILNQHLGKRSVVLFGPCAIENQGRNFNLNIRHTDCTPCYEWGTHKYGLSMKRSELPCHAHCMTDLKPDYVVDKIRSVGWV